MTDDEREELIEKMAKAAWESDGSARWQHLNAIEIKYCLRDARAALAVAEPVIAARAREEEHKRLKQELMSLDL